MKREFISVIVPVYNVEYYLKQCLDSIVNQTYRNLEIIVVDDGSTDSSGDICDEYAQIDARIKVIHKENGGLSSARNAGLDVCTSGGELIAFVDSDDWLELDMFEVLYTNLKEKNVDIACVGYYQCYMNKIVKGNFCKGKLYSGENLISEICEDGYYNLAVWNKLFKRSIFDKIRFPENRYEDAFIFFEILERVSKVYISQETKYFYRQRKDSIMNKVFDDNVLDNITYRELFLETAHKRYQRLIPLMSFNCKMGYFFVLGILAKSKDIKNKFELARELQRKMREGIKEVIKSDKVNFNGKIAYTSLAVSFKLYQYLFELNKFIKKLSGKQNILYP